MAETQMSANVMHTNVYHRSVRSYTSKTLDRETIDKLLATATSSLTGLCLENRAFVVVQGRRILKYLFGPRKIAHAPETTMWSAKGRTQTNGADDTAFDRLHDTDTLILICSQLSGSCVACECLLAAEDLMMSACTMGIESCVLVSAIAGLNAAQRKAALGVPDALQIVAPVVLRTRNGNMCRIKRAAANIGIMSHAHSDLSLGQLRD